MLNTLKGHHEKLIIIASLFTGLLVYAQTQSENPLHVLQKKVHCGSAKEVIGELMNGNYKEKPFWMGDEPGTNSKYVLMVNERSKSWTMYNTMVTQHVLSAPERSTNKCSTGPRFDFYSPVCYNTAWKSKTQLNGSKCLLHLRLTSISWATIPI